MSVLLRDAVRRFLREVEDVIPIHDRSTLADLRRLVLCEERAASSPEPAVVRDTDVHVARLTEALLLFAKPGGHFAGCPGDKRGRCSEDCLRAQGALTRERLDWHDGTIAALMDTIAALERERWALVLKVKGLQRPPGRPRKTPPLQAAQARR